MVDSGLGTSPWRPDSPAGVWLRSVCAGSSPEHWPPLPEGHWPRVLELARRHRLGARAGGRLAAGGAGEGGGREALVGLWRQSLGDQALFAELLGRIGAAAARAGLPCLALKGADLARRIYPPGERSSNDLDLLVPESRLEEAEALLAREGFRPDHPEPLLARRHWFASTYRHRDRPRLQVDLHWGLAAAGRARWRLGDLFARREPLEGVEGISVMAAEDLLVYLALHAVAFHGAMGRWIWWLDLHLLTSPESPLADPSTAFLRARDVGGAVALVAALHRAEEFYPSGHGAGRARPAGGLRARWINGLAGAWEGRRTGHWGRHVIAALAVDHPWDLARVGWSVCRRGLDRRGAG